MRPPSIFVSIASYRDTETPHTLADLYAKAKNPERVFVGLFWQAEPGTDDDCVLVPPTVPHQQLVGIHIHPKESRGACWARNRILTELRQNEDYVLQIDSHMRFVEHWDEKMLRMLECCDSTRALLSTYPLAYTPPANLAEPSISLMMANKFNHHGLLMPMARTLDYSQRPAKPLPSPFLSAGFLFGPSAAFDEVPYDPYLYFIGEEISLAVRLWTHGWDVYNPNDVLIYHCYGPPEQRPRHWTDNEHWGDMDNSAGKRLRHLLEIERSTEVSVLRDLETYGLGLARNLAEFERYADVNFRLQTIGVAAACGKFAPHPSKEYGELSRVFERVYHQNLWQSIESRSGSASTTQATVELRKGLAEMFQRLGIRSLLDAGCGDVNWMQMLSLDLETYLGVDIVQPLTEQNLRLLSHQKGHFFSNTDIVTGPLPAMDAILCRHVLNLLPTELALKALKNMLASGSRWLIASTRQGVANLDTEVGVFRDIDLTKSPFNLPPPDGLIADGTCSSLGFWRKNCT